MSDEICFWQTVVIVRTANWSGLIECFQDESPGTGGMIEDVADDLVTFDLQKVIDEFFGLFWVGDFL